MMNNFKLLKIDNVTYTCHDLENGVACTFEKHRFNETQSFSIERPNELTDPLVIARIMRQMEDWLVDNCHDVVMEVDHRVRIGQEIKNKRIALGLTQTELGDKCSIKQAHITCIENGKYNVKFETIQKIAEALNCNLSLIEDET